MGIGERVWYICVDDRIRGKGESPVIPNRKKKVRECPW